jgi:hypothetical protein
MVREGKREGGDVVTVLCLLVVVSKVVCGGL